MTSNLKFPDLDKLYKPRSVFAPGQRMRMNVVPMFINVFVPWGVFVFCCGVVAFYYAKQPTATIIAIATIFLIWFITVPVAIWFRRHDPNPTWFTYASLAVLVAAVAGVLCGNSIYTKFIKSFYEVQDLNVATGVNPMRDRGSDNLDSGVFNFVPGTIYDDTRSWHFKKATVYCVAPIITNVSSFPGSGQYDYWAAGTDCCSLAASDFRCGAWASQTATSGIRLTDSKELGFYQLAVQQAASLYDITAPNPIFVRWSQDPLLEVGGWMQQAFKLFVLMCLFAFITCLFFVTMCTCRFSFLGRAKTPLATEFYNDAVWLTGSPPEPQDYRTMSYSA